MSKRRKTLPMRRPDRLEEDVEQGNFIMDLTPAINRGTATSVRLAPVKFMGDGMVQCTFIHSLEVDVNSSSTNVIVIGAVAPDIVNPGYGKNILAIERSISTAGRQPSKDVNRIYPFNVLFIGVTSATAIDARLKWDVMRIPVMEYWRIVMQDYEVNLDNVFLMDSFNKSSFAADFWRPNVFPSL